MARNNLSPEAQQYIRQRDSIIDSLVRDVADLKSRSLMDSRQLAGLAQSVGATSMQVVPFELIDQPVATAGNPVPLPAADFGYDRAVILANFYTLCSFSTTAVRSTFGSAELITDGDPPGSVASSRFQSTNSPFSNLQISGSWSVDLRLMTSPDWYFDVDNNGAYDANFNPDTSYTSVRGSILYFKEQ